MLDSLKKHSSSSSSSDDENDKDGGLTSQQLHQRHSNQREGISGDSSEFQLMPHRRKEHGSDGDMAATVLASSKSNAIEEPDGLMTTSNAAGVDDEGNSDFWQTFAGVAGNVLEWYDFAVFGFFDDIIGEVFFPPGSQGEAGAFLVFGGAFVMRPIGGLLLGYLGDTVGRKKALVVSIFLMAFPTFAMGCRKFNFHL